MSHLPGIAYNINDGVDMSHSDVMYLRIEYSPMVDEIVNALKEGELDSVVASMYPDHNVWLDVLEGPFYQYFLRGFCGTFFIISALIALYFLLEHLKNFYLRELQVLSYSCH